MVPSVLPRLMDTSMDMSMFTWPWPETTSWDEIQPEMGWEGKQEGGGCSFLDARGADG